MYRTDVHPFLFEFAAKSAVKDRGVAQAGFDRLSLDALIAHDLHLNLVTLFVEAEMFQPGSTPIQVVPPMLVIANRLCADLRLS